MKSRRLIACPRADDEASYRATHKIGIKPSTNVRFGSKADMCSAQADVR